MRPSSRCGNWILTGEPAPASIYYERDATGVPIRNAQHISSGGIHLPELVAPTVFFDAWNGPPYRFPCAVGGYTIDYKAAELKEMYGNHGKYVSLISRTESRTRRSGLHARVRSRKRPSAPPPRRTPPRTGRKSNVGAPSRFAGEDGPRALKSG